MALHRRIKTYFSIVAAILCSFLFPRVLAAGPHRVVVVVWDGMRPDFVGEQNTPALWRLAQNGVTFRNHHAVYLGATNVNGTAIATGVYPARSGLIANREFRPKIDNQNPIDVEAASAVKKGDELSGGKYIATPTVAELVERSGGRAVIAASKTVGLLHNRNPNQATAKTSVTFSAGAAWPNDALAPLIAALGPFPKSHVDRDNWTTKALTDVLWKDGVPIFSVLWLGEPDLTQHETAPGAGAALRAIKSSDDNLAAVLAELDRQRLRETTDIFVVSDHGFSTIEREVELPKILQGAGFNAVTEFKSAPKPGDIMTVGGGGSVLFYVMEQDPAVVRRLVEFLQQSNFAGVIFTKEAVDGTFTLDKAKIDSADAPDVVLSFRWNETKNQFGVPGMIDADWQRAAGKGTHATLSRFDMHNTLIAAGPDFRRGQIDDLPSGNVDLAPTILKILEIRSPQPMDGRVLSEALVKSASSPVRRIRPVADRTDSSRGEIDQQTVKPEIETIEATKSFSTGRWRQTLQVSRLGSTMYLDQGNGAFVRPK
jgi:arylsulfatase A-like enzyme